VSWAFLNDAIGWRESCLVWAALNLGVGLRLNWLVLPNAPKLAGPNHAARLSIGWKPHKEMFLLAFVFAAAWFVTGSVAAHLPRLLEAWGATPVKAIVAAALVGPAQVAARLGETPLSAQALREVLTQAGCVPAIFNRF
jgi:hypothetical protein